MIPKLPQGGIDREIQSKKLMAGNNPAALAQEYEKTKSITTLLAMQSLSQKLSKEQQHLDALMQGPEGSIIEQTKAGLIALADPQSSSSPEIIDQIGSDIANVGKKIIADPQTSITPIQGKGDPTLLAKGVASIAPPYRAAEGGIIPPADRYAEGGIVPPPQFVASSPNALNLSAEQKADNQINELIAKMIKQGMPQEQADDFRRQMKMGRGRKSNAISAPTNYAEGGKVEAKEPTILYGDSAVAAVEEDIGKKLTPNQNKLVKLEGYVVGTKTDKKTGEVTTGAGQTGQYMEMPFDEVYEAHVKRVRGRIPNFDKFPEDVQGELVNSEYRGVLGGSPKAVGLINQGKFEEASEELLDNDEFKNPETSKGIIDRFYDTSSAIASLEDSKDSRYRAAGGAFEGSPSTPKKSKNEKERYLERINETIALNDKSRKLNRQLLEGFGDGVQEGEVSILEEASEPPALGQVEAEQNKRRPRPEAVPLEMQRMYDTMEKGAMSPKDVNVIKEAMRKETQAGTLEDLDVFSPYTEEIEREEKDLQKIKKSLAGTRPPMRSARNKENLPTEAGGISSILDSYMTPPNSDIDEALKEGIDPIVILESVKGDPEQVKYAIQSIVGDYMQPPKGRPPLASAGNEEAERPPLASAGNERVNTPTRVFDDPTQQLITDLGNGQSGVLGPDGLSSARPTDPTAANLESLDVFSPYTEEIERENNLRKSMEGSVANYMTPPDAKVAPPLQVGQRPTAKASSPSAGAPPQTRQEAMYAKNDIRNKIYRLKTTWNQSVKAGKPNMQVKAQLDAANAEMAAFNAARQSPPSAMTQGRKGLQMGLPAVAAANAQRMGQNATPPNAPANMAGQVAASGAMTPPAPQPPSPMTQGRKGLQMGFPAMAAANAQGMPQTPPPQTPPPSAPLASGIPAALAAKPPLMAAGNDFATTLTDTTTSTDTTAQPVTRTGLGGLADELRSIRTESRNLNNKLNDPRELAWQKLYAGGSAALTGNGLLGNFTKAAQAEGQRQTTRQFAALNQQADMIGQEMQYGLDSAKNEALAALKMYQAKADNRQINQQDYARIGKLLNDMMIERANGLTTARYATDQQKNPVEYELKTKRWEAENADLLSTIAQTKALLSRIDMQFTAQLGVNSTTGQGAAGQATTGGVSQNAQAFINAP